MWAIGGSFPHDPDTVGDRCNAPRLMCQVSSSYSLLLPCHCLRVMHCISCHHVHFICIHVRLMHLSIFPVVRFAIRCSYVIRRPFLLSCCERVLKFLGMARGLPSGLGIAPVDHLSSFGSFGARLVLQRLTGHPQSPFECPANPPSKPAQNPPKPPPSSRAFDHDRVAENHTSFGLS